MPPQPENDASSVIKSQDSYRMDPRFLRLLWCDAGGVRRCRVLPYKASSSGIGLTKGVMAMPAYADSCIPESGLGPVGEIQLLPDANTIARLPWHPSHAIALADMHTKADGRSTSEPWEACPRSALKRAMKHAADRGVQLHVGFELEFYLLREADGGKLEPVDKSVYCQTSSLDAMATVLDDIMTALERMKIEVVQFHAEAGGGQFEVALGSHRSPLAAADQLLLAKEAVSAVATRHGLLASFHPKPVAGSAGSGTHCHFNLMDRGGRNCMLAEDAGEAGVLRPEAEAFLAGVLHHLPALLPWVCPSRASYSRLVPLCWAGAFGCWGWDNREAALRLTGGLQPPPPTSGETTFDMFDAIYDMGTPVHHLPGAFRAAAPRPEPKTRAELKAFDGSANPHLGLAALIVAGLAGMEAARKLPGEARQDPSGLSEKEREAIGAERLPKTLQDTVEAAQRDQEFLKALNKVLGEPLVKAFLAVRQATAEQHFMEPLLRF